jgi:hypothetical protein
LLGAFSRIDGGDHGGFPLSSARNHSITLS